MFPTKFRNYTIVFISEFTKYIISIVEINCKLSFGNGRFPVIDADIPTLGFYCIIRWKDYLIAPLKCYVDCTLFRKFTAGIMKELNEIRKSAAPIRFLAVDFLVIPEISLAIFPT